MFVVTSRYHSLTVNEWYRLGIAVTNTPRPVGLRSESELFDLRGLRGYGQPLAIALHKNIGPGKMLAGFPVISRADFIVGAGDHGSFAEHTDFHVAQRGGVYVAAFDFSGSLGLSLALAVRRDGDPVICH